MKAYCKDCGQWLNVHGDGKCHDCHYGIPHDRGVPTAKEIERMPQGSTDRRIEGTAVEGPYTNTLKNEATENQLRAANEPILGKMTHPEDGEAGNLNRESPAGTDADDQRKAPNQALPAEIKAQQVNAAASAETAPDPAPAVAPLPEPKKQAGLAKQTTGARADRGTAAKEIGAKR